MPNLVVYVPADVARALEAKGVSEVVQRRACNEVLYGLAENGLVAGGVVVSRGLGSGEVSAPSPPVAGAGSPEPSPLDVVSPDAAQGVRVGKASFRPDPKKKP